MTVIVGRFPTCQEVADHARNHPAIETHIGQWFMCAEGEVPSKIRMQVLGTGDQERVFILGGKGLGLLRATKETWFMPLTGEGLPVEDGEIQALVKLLGRLGGEPRSDGATIESLSDEIWSHVQFLEENVRDGAEFRHATRLLRLVEEFFPYQALPELKPDVKGGFEDAITALTQALTSLKEGITSGVETALDTARNQTDGFAERVRVLVHARDGLITATLALSNEHEIEVLQGLGWQPMDVTRIKLGNSLTVMAQRR